LWTDWDEIFRVSSHWANLETIKFWALNSSDNGFLKGEKLPVEDSVVGDIVAGPPNLV